ncbi:hypothetical protein PQX77_011302 [Marasmius sp. AFHP31]|nr:hypothetical protein PQX77_011302 [Marasmius sp. AFHP31]
MVPYSFDWIDGFWDFLKSSRVFYFSPFGRQAHMESEPTSKNSQFVSLMQEDAPNFVNTAVGFQVIPVDVVSFEIPK